MAAKTWSMWDRPAAKRKPTEKSRFAELEAVVHDVCQRRSVLFDSAATVASARSRFPSIKLNSIRATSASTNSGMVIPQLYCQFQFSFNRFERVVTSLFMNYRRSIHRQQPSHMYVFVPHQTTKPRVREMTTWTWIQWRKPRAPFPRPAQCPSFDVKRSVVETTRSNAP